MIAESHSCPGRKKWPLPRTERTRTTPQQQVKWRTTPGDHTLCSPRPPVVALRLSASWRSFVDLYATQEFALQIDPNKRGSTVARIKTNKTSAWVSCSR